jgi:hypothetical protein
LCGKNPELTKKIEELNSLIRELNSDPVRDSATTDTLNVPKKLEIKTQSGLIGDDKSALVET